MSFEIHTRELFETDDRSFSPEDASLRNVAWQATSAVVALGALIALVSLLVGS